MGDATTPIPKVPVALACEIAGVDRRRFNEAVADGSYPCPPETGARQRRFFEEADLLGMCVFERLIHMRLHKADAGRMACDVVEHFQNAQRDGDKTLTHVVFPSGIHHYHGIPIHTDEAGLPIDPDVTEAEFVGIEIRVSTFIRAIRQRYSALDTSAVESDAE